MVPPEGKDVAVYDVTAKADLQALLLPAAAHDSNIDAASLQRQQQPVSLTVAVILAQVLQLNDRADRLFRQNAGYYDPAADGAQNHKVMQLK